MTTEQLITKQQLEIETLKEETISWIETAQSIVTQMYAIGGPLNDNRLEFNIEQRKFLRSISQQLEALLPFQE